LKEVPKLLAYTFTAHKKT